MPFNISAEHENLCRAEARVIIHNEDLWKEYLAEAERTYLKRSEKYPDTGRVVAEYANGFDRKYGKNLEDGRDFASGKVLRNDIFIMKDGKVVAQFVDFIGRTDIFGAINNYTCLGAYPDLYSRVEKIND